MITPIKRRVNQNRVARPSRRPGLQLARIGIEVKECQYQPNRLKTKDCDARTLDKPWHDVCVYPTIQVGRRNWTA